MKKYGVLAVIALVGLCGFGRGTVMTQDFGGTKVIASEIMQETRQPLVRENADGSRKYYKSKDFIYYAQDNGYDIVLAGITDNSTACSSGKIVIPACVDGYSVKKIGDNFLSGYKNIKTVVISDGIDRIGRHAFGYMRDLESVSLGNDIKYIGECAFSGDRSLKKIIGGRHVEQVGEAAFMKCTKLKSVPVFMGKSKFDYCGTASLCGSGVQSIRMNPNTEYCDSVFASCKRLKKVSFANKIQTVERDTFLNCVQLQKVTFHGKIVKIKSGAFENCKNLKKLKLPKSINKIEKNAFQGCKKLTLYVKKGSYAHNYAKKHHIKYKYYK